MANDPSDNDDALLARLNALKTSNVSFEPRKISSNELSSEVNPTQSSGQDDLIDRFRGLAGIANISPAAGSGYGQDEDDGKTVEELLAELGPEDQWTLNPDEPNEMQKLLNEARQVLSQKEEQPLSRHSEEPSRSSANLRPVPQLPSTGAPATTSEVDAEAPPIQTEDEEAASYLQQILDELQLEEHDETTNEPSYDNENENGISGQSPSQNPYTEAGKLPSINMPSVPTSVPLIPHQPTEDNSAPTLNLPSAPTTAPQRKSTSQRVNARPPQYTDKDIETWCVICNDDATKVIWERRQDTTKGVIDG
ncbi:hypothetical protein MMC18_008167 [Xylographa bjoerkii]|nr:hypothetical protein [Xylographa bjoerkii]